MTVKKSILIVWPYEREDLIRHFKELYKYYNVVYLNRRDRDGDEKFVLPETCRVIYWNNYKNAQELIGSVRPSMIIFMSLVSTYTIALNIAAKKALIPTVIMQHGNTEPLNNMHEAILEKRRVGSRDSEQMNKSSLLFFFKTVKLYNPVLIFRQLRFLFYKGTKTTAFALGKAFYHGLKPCYIFVFNKYMGRHLVSKYRAENDTIVEVGNFAFEQIEEDGENESLDINYRYLLFIDQPLPELKFADGSRINLHTFYNKLAGLLDHVGFKLLVKAHPHSIKSSLLNEEDSYILWRGKLNQKLVKQAEAVSGFFSTLLIPTIELKRAIIFKIKELSFYQDVSDLVQIVDLTKSNEWSSEFINDLKTDNFIFNRELFAKRFKLENSGTIKENLVRALKEIER